MGMWLLIVITGFWTSGLPGMADVYSFHEFKTEAQCLQMKKWIEDRQIHSKHHQVEVQCVKSD
jgi:hypothetical protein